MSQPISSPPVRVWDLFVRIFHWSLVACVFLNFLVEEGEAPHQWIGYAASALVAARIVWGFVGSRYARFSDFFPTPTRLRQHLAALLAGKPEHHVGHNPFGALMMLALMALVLSLGFTGYLQTTDMFWGDEWLEEVHEFFGNTLLFVVLAHIGLIALLSVLRRKNQALPMLTGRVQGPGPNLAQRNHGWLAAAVLACVLAFWTWQWNTAPELPAGDAARWSENHHDDDDD